VDARNASGSLLDMLERFDVGVVQLDREFPCRPCRRSCISRLGRAGGELSSIPSPPYNKEERTRAEETP
jgi:hypothetical protein